MTTGLQKFRLLLWKNYVLQKRHKVQTVMELLVPLFFTALLVAMRGLVSSDLIETPLFFPAFNVGRFEGTSVSGGCAILYAPDNTLTKSLMNDPLLRTFFPNSNYTFVQGYNTTEEMERAYIDFNGLSQCGQNGEPWDKPMEDRNENPVLAAIVFNNDFSTANNSWKNLKDVSYTLRFPAVQHYGGDNEEFGSRARWRTELLYPIFQIMGPRENVTHEMELEDPKEYAFKVHGGSPGYWGEGFLYFQHAVDTTLRKLMSGGGNDWTPKEVQLQRMPYPKYIDDIFLIALQNWLPIIVVFSFIYSVINITKSITHEKEKRLKESMKMMGLPNYLHWLAWFVKSYIFILISLIFMVALIKIKIYDGGNLAVLTESDGTLIFVFLLVYAWSMVTLSFFISTLFSTANSAATAAGVIFFLSYFPYTFLQQRYDSLSKSTKVTTSLLSNTGLSFGCQIISMWEGAGAGVQWSNIADVASPDDNWSFLDILIILFVDGVLYLLLALYVEGVWPGEYGIPMPWYFPFTKWYWFGTPQADAVSVVSSADTRQKKPQNFEKEPSGRAGVQIQGLTKSFGKKTAVNSLYLNFFDDQITALLGHNGAGKTTTMSMLTGLFPPSSGTAIVNGYDIRHDIQSVRENLGLCPQHDVLFDEMTVKEHLEFFAQLKGCNGKLVSQEVKRMLKAINLEMKKNVQSHKLSGGMKRRLSVGIAFVGGSRVVLLDEPSSGLDPGARRQIWDLIQIEKRNRTIILSTHFMDEADLLGDRIAILAEGTVQCCGSSLFLKKKYGGGYHLIIVKVPHCDVNRITDFLRRRIPNVEIDQNVGSELSYSLPDDLSHLFADMFEELEARKDELGIASYGASITTMEEVFMRVGKEAEEEKMREENGGVITVKVENGQHSKKLYQQLNKNSGVSLLLQQLKAMIVKKFLYTIRNKVLLAVQTIIPIAFLIITLVMLETLPDENNPPELNLSLQSYHDYGDPLTTMHCTSVPDVCDKFGNFTSSLSTIVKAENVSQSIIERATVNLPEYNFQQIVGFETFQNGTLRGLFNNQPFHAPPVALNLINNALLRSELDSNHTIHVNNYPLPLSIKDEVDNIVGAQSSGFNIGFTVSFGMSFLAASFVVFLIKERETNAKHLQVVSGVKFTVFWIASFIFDAINFILPCIGLLIVLVAFQNEDFKSFEMIGHFFLVLLFYGWSVIPFMYLFSFAFTIPSSGFTRMVMFNIFTGMATILAVTILQVPELELTHIADALEWIFMIFPNFNLGYSIAQLSGNNQLLQKCPLVSLTLPEGFCENIDPDFLCCAKFPVSFLDWKPMGIGRNILAMFLIGVVCFLIIFVMESKIIQRIRFGGRSNGVSSRRDDEEVLLDADVLTENMRVRNTELKHMFQTDNLILRDLTKVYGKFTAVDSLCLGVQKGECFGLLGINGAGKSTTFKMLTGDIPVTSGDAFIYGNSIKSDIKKVQQQLGYCPQFDALIPELTGRETIRLFARLRGVNEPEIDALANDLASKLLFTQHIDKPCGTYSGGNKRKLSTALALVGNPPMVLLDEPTTGMDPVARRHLWDAISDIREAGTSIVLTSHSMDECEALSTRLAIMVNGAFRCLGSTQHLKNKFGEGYTLIAQIETGRDETKITRQSIEMGRRRSSLLKQEGNNDQLQHWERELYPIRNYIERTFPGCELKDVHAGYVHYHIKDKRITWGYMFRKMEEAKHQFKIEAYSVGQTTLEQVFLNFTRAQVNSDED